MVFSKKAFISAIVFIAVIAGSIVYFNRQSRLIDIVRRGDLKEAEKKISSGVDVNAITQVGDRQECPLSCAVRFQNENLVALLLAHDANVNITLEPFSILMIACDSKDGPTRRNIIKMLLKNGADLNFKTKSDQFDALHLSVIGDSPDVIELLLQNGANVNSVDSLENSLIHTAARYCVDRKQLKVIKDLCIKYNININLRNRYDVSVKDLIKDIDNGATEIHWKK